MPGRAQRDLTIQLHERRDGNALVTMARDLERLSHGMDTASGSMQRMRQDAQLLDAEIAKTKTRILDLGSQVARTGDTSLFKDIRFERRILSELEQLREEISKEESRIGVSFGRSLAGGIAEGFAAASRNTKLILVAGGLAAAMAPVIGAAVSGALSGTVIGGAMAAGIMAAARDDRVQQAWQDFAAVASTKFRDAGSILVDPVIRALKRLELEVDLVDLETMFRRIAPHIEKVADGVAMFVRELMPGLNKALENSGPLSEAFAQGLGQLGHALGTFLTDISQSEGAVDGLVLTMTTLSTAIEYTGKALRFLSDMFDYVAPRATVAMGAFYGVFSGFLVNFSGFRAFADRAAEGIDRIGRSARNTTKNTKELTEATKRWLDTIREADDVFYGLQLAEIDVEQNLDALRESLKRSKGSIDVHKDTSREARRDLVLYAQSVQELVSARFKETGSVNEAIKTYNHYRDQLIRTLIATGETRKEAEKLASTWLHMPDEVRTKVIVTGVIDAATEALRKINFFGGSSVKRRQHGGPVESGRAFLVGEAGPELLLMGPGAHGRVEPIREVPPITPAPPPVEVRVFLGDQELRGMVRTEVREMNRQTLSRILAGQR